jgi:hypothetical protein
MVVHEWVCTFPLRPSAPRHRAPRNQAWASQTAQGFQPQPLPSPRRLAMTLHRDIQFLQSALMVTTASTAWFPGVSCKSCSLSCSWSWSWELGASQELEALSVEGEVVGTACSRYACYSCGSIGVLDRLWSLLEREAFRPRSLPFVMACRVPVGIVLPNYPSCGEIRRLEEARAMLPGGKGSICTTNGYIVIGK